MLFVLVLVLSVSQVKHTTALTQDGLSLLALKASILHDPTRSLASWTETDTSPCNWHGIFCSHKNRVTSLYLPNKALTGYIPSELGRIDSLTRIILSNNNFTNTIPRALFNATMLQYVDLSRNRLTGTLPSEVKNAKGLTHLDVSGNLLSGFLPESVVELKKLTGTLNLSWNGFSGEVPVSYGGLPVKLSLDLRHNNLTGKVPQVGSLMNQGPTAFAGNELLCGFPLGRECPEAQDPNIGPQRGPEGPRDSEPELSNVVGDEKGRSSSGAVLVISVGVGVFGLVFVVMWVVWRARKDGDGEGKMGREEKIKGVEVDVEEGGGGQNGKFVVVDEGFEVDLEDLLRASAYVVGKSKSGILYRVVVGGRGLGSGLGVVGSVVAVRRLSEGDVVWKLKEFENEVEAIAKVQHPNIVRLRAYYYAVDEKLLITDFIKNGSLYNALHGGPSNTLSQLSWSARLKIAQGAARGLMYMHECSPRKYVHGNIKSSKILLDDDIQPFISGFGITRLVAGTPKFANAASKKINNNTMSSALGTIVSSSLNVYLAPEARVAGSKLTQKSDVYSFGIVLLEILTGQLPDAGPENDGKGLEGFVRKVFREELPLSEVIDPALLKEVHAKKQVIAAFHVALNCTELDPELRPKMRTVSESLDRIKSQ